MMEVLIRHDGEQYPPVAIDAFTDGPGDFVIGPEPDTRFLVRSDIRRDDVTQLRILG
jgi:hypothetical protein